MKRRSFFKSLAKAAAIVALAPQLAFRVKPLEWTTYQYQRDWVETFFYGKPIRYMDEEYIKRLCLLLPEKFHIEHAR